jgi:hypothetical protein
MSEQIPSTVAGGFFSIREVSWILGVDESEVSRMIRVGTLPAIRRRSRLVVPAYAVARLLPTPFEGGNNG